MRAQALLRVCTLAAAALLGSVAVLSAQGTVEVSTPVAVNFIVTDVSSTTSASGPASVSLANISVAPGSIVRVGIRADTAAFARPSASGGTIAADKVHWTVSSASNGTGWSGQLSSASFSTLFESTVAATSASVTLDFTLSATGGGILAGDHELIATWKFESITP